MSTDKILVLSSAVITNKRGELLLLQRSKNNSSYQMCWQPPEGKMEYGESPEQTLKREIKEETGLYTTFLKLKCVTASRMYARGESYHVIRIVYKVFWRGNLRLSDNHLSFGWFSVKKAKLLKNKIDGLKEMLSALEGKR